MIRTKVVDVIGNTVLSKAESVNKMFIDYPSFVVEVSDYDVCEPDIIRTEPHAGSWRGSNEVESKLRFVQAIDFLIDNCTEGMN